jgi:hypothetical protein
MTEAKAGEAREADARVELEARLAQAQDLLGRVRRAVADGGLAEVDRLAPLLRGLAQQLGRLPQADRRLRARLLALLDEIGSLIQMLRAEQARLAVRLRAVGAHRRAGTAYRRASRL